MESFSDRAGTEFDWVATDESGSVALFATGGAGPVPVHLPGDAAQHDLIADQIDVVGWGSNAVWDSYARAGLFAYDWDDQHQRYARVASPKHPLNQKLLAQLANAVLPRLSLSFSESETIRVDVA